MQPTLAFYIVGSFVFLALMGFSLISVYERRFKAVILVAIFAFVFEAFWFFLGFQFPEASNMITVVFAGSSAIILVLVSMPVTKPKSLKINVQNAGRIDERDIVFARDRLVPDTVQYNEYYNNLHPEFKKIDDKIRKMPFPGEPGGKLFDDIKTQYANASFDLVDDIRHLAMPALPEDSSKIVRSAQEFAKIIKNFAKYLGVLDVRITELKSYHTYSNIGRTKEGWGEEIALKHKYAIAFTTEMNYFMVRKSPNPEIIIESAFQYSKIANIALTLVKLITRLGYASRAHIDGNYQVLCNAVAHDAGIGELSRMGLLITPRHGPRVRIGVVTTDLPLIVDKPRTFGVQDFCEVCKICAEKCPSGAIDLGKKRDIKGIEKWQSKQENCFQYWKTIGTDCGICLDSCPYSAPSNVFHNSMRMIIKRNPLARRFAILFSKIMY